MKMKAARERFTRQADECGILRAFLHVMQTTPYK
jgi:hypothetical protein